jgi:CubicO group peptidase (beta-lactamase class C family)
LGVGTFSVELTPSAIIERAIGDRAFPAAVIETGTSAGPSWTRAFGHLTYERDAQATREDTIFDLASLTKVMVTTPLVMRAVEAGLLSIDEPIAGRLTDWRGVDRARVTIGDLLEHASGLTAYLPFFRDHQGRAEFQAAICALPLEYEPRSQSIYSDLGFMLLAFILEDVYRAPFAELFAPAPDLMFNPPRALRDRTAPTEVDLFRGRLLQGEVHDENTWALGGAAGHAGLFGTAAGVGAFARGVLSDLIGGSPAGRTSQVRRFVRKSTVPGSSRALGWDTMLPTSSCGTRMSPHAIGHTGFTGTSLWIDPERDRYVVFLTNRVHPSRDNNQVQAVRRALHDSIVGSKQ